ncbi:cupin domain-containing protein [Promicromonospora sp. Marseille-Q5078]
MSIQLIEQSTLPDADFEGYLHGAGVSVMFERIDRDGAGPRLHRHPYPETFIVWSGRALFRVGDDEVVAVGGQILVAPAGTPHTFSVIGPEVYEALHVHANDRFVTEWLE